MKAPKSHPHWGTQKRTDQQGAKEKGRTKEKEKEKGV
jgi:hypothetical protein